MSNDKFLLSQLVESRRADIAPEYSVSQFFEFFVAEQLLKNYGLSDEEVEEGRFGGGNDGGIDAIFAFVEEQNLTSNPDLSRIPREPTVELVVIQAKTANGFGEDAVNKLRHTLEDLLQFETVPLDMLSERYHPELRDFFDEYRSTVRQLIPKFPKFSFRVFYATYGDSSQVHRNVVDRAKQLEASVKNLLHGSTAKFAFLGAGDLLELARKQISGPLSLKVVEYLSAEDGGHLCLVDLFDYSRFISDAEGKRRAELFTANVREYEGDVAVNEGIRASLETVVPIPNFWWLNNGITIVASKATMTGKQLTLEDAKVVNGLQTSHEIHKFFAAQPTSEQRDKRLLLVRVIVTEAEDIRNQIIRATNSQSQIKPYALRATEKIHFNIEQHFGYNGLHYERQKNYYKNLGKSRRTIVSIQYVAQAMAAILLRRPNDSRGRPTNLLKNESTYSEVFSPNYPINAYLKATQILRRVDSFLRTEANEDARREYTNLRYQTAMYASCKVLGSVDFHANHLESFPLEALDSAFLEGCVEDVFSEMNQIAGDQRWDLGRVSKNAQLDQALLRRVKS